MQKYFLFGALAIRESWPVLAMIIAFSEANGTPPLPIHCSFRRLCRLLAVCFSLDMEWRFRMRRDKVDRAFLRLRSWD